MLYRITLSNECKWSHNQNGNGLNHDRISDLNCTCTKFQMKVATCKIGKKTMTIQFMNSHHTRAKYLTKAQNQIILYVLVASNFVLKFEQQDGQTHTHTHPFYFTVLAQSRQDNTADFLSGESLLHWFVTNLIQSFNRHRFYPNGFSTMLGTLT